MGDIDLGKLSREEQAEYARLGRMDNYPVREQLSMHRTSAVLATVWLLVSCGVLVVATTRVSEPGGLPLLFGALGLMAVGFGVWLWAASRIGTRAVRSRQAAFLSEIGYETRFRHRPAPDGDTRLPSNRQRQHEWYEDNRDLNWQDRKVAEMYGMDADTYKSNLQGD